MAKPQPARAQIPDPEHSERGSGRAVGVVEQAEACAPPATDAPAAEPAEPSRGARPCQMMLGAPDEEPRSCGAPSVGGGKLYRYCRPHLEQVERAGGVVHRDGWA